MSAIEKVMGSDALLLKAPFSKVQAVPVVKLQA